MDPEEIQQVYQELTEGLQGLAAQAQREGGWDRPRWTFEVKNLVRVCGAQHRYGVCVTLGENH